MSLEKLDLFLFVSHVAENRASAMEIVDELERRGMRCLIAPRDIQPASYSTTRLQAQSKPAMQCFSSFPIFAMTASTSDAS
jgi:hypothetical protein